MKLPGDVCGVLRFPMLYCGTDSTDKVHDAVNGVDAYQELPARFVKFD